MNFDILALIFSGIFIGLLVIPIFWTGDPSLPTSMGARRKMLTVLPDFLPDIQCSKIYELGSGWGGLANALAKKYPDKTVIGVELSPVPYFFSRLRQAYDQKPNLIFNFCDFFSVNLSDANLVVCYLSPKTMKKLSGKLRLELPKDSLIISNTFALRDWDALETQISDDIFKSPILLYKIDSNMH